MYIAYIVCVCVCMYLLCVSQDSFTAKIQFKLASKKKGNLLAGTAK